MPVTNLENGIAKQPPLRAVVEDLYSLLYSVYEVSVELHSNIIGKPPEPAARHADPVTSETLPVIPLATSIGHMYSHTKYIMDILVSVKSQL